MNLEEAIAESQELALSIYGLRFNGDRRTRTALACFAIAQQHHSAILILLRNRPPVHASAFALLRPLLEATLRGEWVYYCATDKQVTAFLEKEKGQMDMSSLLRSLEQQLDLKDAHAILYQKAWPLLSSMTHSFAGQISMWFGRTSIEPSYPEDLVQELINWSGKILKLGVATIQNLSTSSSSNSQSGSEA